MFMPDTRFYTYIYMHVYIISFNSHSKPVCRYFYSLVKMKTLAKKLNHLLILSQHLT